MTPLKFWTKMGWSL